MTLAQMSLLIRERNRMQGGGKPKPKEGDLQSLLAMRAQAR